MNPQLITLSNGLRVILIDTKAFPTLTTLLLVGAGSRYENSKNNGIAHFFEHMAFKGSKKYPDTFIISSTIEGLGGIFNAFTGKDHTGYWIKSTNEHFETVVDVLSDMVLNSFLRPEEIEKEKGVIVEEINLYEDTPSRRVGELYEGLIYQNSPLGFDIAGSKETVRSFNRDTFVNYMQDLYFPENALLVVAGGLSQISNPKSQNYLNIIEEKFKNWKGKKTAGFEKFKGSQSKPNVLIKYKKTEQAHFCLGFPTFSFFNPKKYALSVLSTILGGGMSSRLFIEVREKRGLCYYISTGRELYHDVGNIVTQAGIVNDLGKIKEAISVTLAEHEKVVKGNINKQEIIKAKELLKGRLLLSMEDSFNVASFFGTKNLLEGKIESPLELIKKIEKVTDDEIVALANELFQRDKLNFALIGPFEEKDFQNIF
jgi:predicted Zn-dependent peptidase